MKYRRRFLMLLAVIPFLSACRASDDLPKPPLSLPFEIQKAGNKVEIKLRVVEDRHYLFRILLMYKEGDQMDRSRVRQLAGAYDMDKTGKLIEPGVLIKLRFKIYSIEAEKERALFERTIMQPEDIRTISHGATSFNKQFAVVDLKPGHYKVSVESLRDVPELIGTPVVFQIGRDPKTGSLPGYLWSIFHDYLP